MYVCMYVVRMPNVVRATQVALQYAYVYVCKLVHMTSGEIYVYVGTKTSNIDHVPTIFSKNVQQPRKNVLA